MPDELPFKLRDTYEEIPASEPEEFWKILGTKNEISDLLYRPDTLKGGEEPQKLYDVKGKTFSNVSFAHTEISNLNFTKCAFEDCIFFRTVFDNLEFHDCSFKNCNFGKCRIKETYIDPGSFSECLDIERYANIGIHLYQQLMRNFKDLDQPDFYRSAEFMFRKFRRSELWYKIKKREIRRREGYPMVLWNFLAEKFLGYGVRIWRFVFTTFVLFFCFWFLNNVFWEEFGLKVLCDNCTKGTWDESLYYTAVSLSNLGYGDIVPSSAYGRMWASFQAVVGAIWFAVMASMIFRRMTSR